jgi:hypothetical protein
MNEEKKRKKWVRKDLSDETKNKLLYENAKALYQLWATVLTNGKGILLPKDCYDRFRNTGARPLIILRFGADKDKAAVGRTGIEGQPIPSRSRQNNCVEPQPVEGSFWSL